jgi:hypothetical protein
LNKFEGNIVDKRKVAAFGSDICRSHAQLSLEPAGGANCPRMPSNSNRKF